MVALALAAAPLVAQAPARPVTFWFNAGYGVGWAKGYSSRADAFSLSGSVQWRWLLVSGRAAGVSFSIFDSVWDLGLLAGIASRPRRSWHVGLAAGLGAMEAQDGTRTLGVPLEAQLFLRFPKIAGWGSTDSPI